MSTNVRIGAGVAGAHDVDDPGVRRSRPWPVTESFFTGPER